MKTFNNLIILFLSAIFLTLFSGCVSVHVGDILSEPELPNNERVPISVKISSSNSYVRQTANKAFENYGFNVVENEFAEIHIVLKEKNDERYIDPLFYVLAVGSGTLIPVKHDYYQEIEANILVENHQKEKLSYYLNTTIYYTPLFPTVYLLPSANVYMVDKFDSTKQTNNSFDIIVKNIAFHVYRMVPKYCYQQKTI